VRHHTKDKGDEGLGQVIADLMTHGVRVAVPLSEHLPFDLIAIGEDGAMRRVQVRYPCLSRGKPATVRTPRFVGGSKWNPQARVRSVGYRCAGDLLPVPENFRVHARRRVTVDWRPPSLIEGEERSGQADARRFGL